MNASLQCNLSPVEFCSIKMSKAGENPLATEMEHILRVAAFCEKRHKLMENLLNTDRDT